MNKNASANGVDRPCSQWLEAILGTMEKLLDEGCKFRKQDGSWFIFRKDGEALAPGGGTLFVAVVSYMQSNGKWPR